MEVSRNVGHQCLITFFVKAGSKLADTDKCFLEYCSGMMMHCQKHGYVDGVLC
jgi:hypothetical protein